MTNFERVGLVGLGNMGIEIAGNLVRSNHEVVALDLSAERRELAEQRFGIDTVDSVNALPDTSILIMSLPAPAISLSVIEDYGRRALDNVTIIETSTVSPNDMLTAARRSATFGMEIVDAAVMAGVDQMGAGKAILLCGGENRVLDQVAPVLSSFSARQMRFGGIGSGMAAKVVNNAVAHALMTVFVEAGSLATATGVSIDSLLELLTDPVMGVQRPLTHRYAERIRQGNYSGGMPTAAALKDSRLALEMAQDNGVPLFAIQACQTVYEMAVARGDGVLDYAAIARLWDDWGVPAAK